MNREFLLKLLEDYSNTPAYSPIMVRGFCHFIFHMYPDKNLFTVSNSYFKKFCPPHYGYILAPLNIVRDREVAKSARVEWLKNHIQSL